MAGKRSQMECGCDFELDNQESGHENPMPLSSTVMEEQEALDELSMEGCSLWLEEVCNWLPSSEEHLNSSRLMRDCICRHDAINPLRLLGGLNDRNVSLHSSGDWTFKVQEQLD